MNNFTHLKQELIKYGQHIYNKNFSPGTSGNISVRCNNGCLISASGTCLGMLTEEDIVAIDTTGNILRSNKKPSSEKFLHLEIYKKRPDINAIIHCHAPKSSAFSVAHITMNEPILSEFIYYFGEIPIAKYALPSSQELVENTTIFFEKHNAVLMANHGIITGAKDLKTAFFQLETIEAYAEVYLNAKVLGKMVYLKEQDIEDIYKLKNS